MSTDVLKELEKLSNISETIKARFPKVSKTCDALRTNYKNTIPIVFYKQLQGIVYKSEIMEIFAEFIRKLEQSGLVEEHPNVLATIATSTIKVAHDVSLRCSLSSSCCGGVELADIFTANANMHQTRAIVIVICDNVDCAHNDRAWCDSELANMICSKIIATNASSNNFIYENMQPLDAVALLSDNSSGVFVKNQLPFEMARLAYENPSIAYKLLCLPIDNFIITRPHEFDLEWYFNEYTERSNCKAYDIGSFNIDAQLTCINQFYPDDSGKLCSVFIMFMPVYDGTSDYTPFDTAITLVIGCVDDLAIMNNIGNIIDALYTILCNQKLDKGKNYYKLREMIDTVVDDNDTYGSYHFIRLPDPEAVQTKFGQLITEGSSSDSDSNN